MAFLTKTEKLDGMNSEELSIMEKN